MPAESATYALGKSSWDLLQDTWLSYFATTKRASFAWQEMVDILPVENLHLKLLELFRQLEDGNQADAAPEGSQRRVGTRGCPRNGLEEGNSLDVYSM